MPKTEHITVTGQAEEDTNLQYRQLLDNAMFPLALVDQETNRILYLNKAAAHFLQIGQNEAVGTYVPDYWVISDQREQFLKRMQESGKVHDFEGILRTGSGEERLVVISSTMVMFENRPAISSVFKDITAQKQINKALRRSEEKYHELYNLMHLMADTVPDMIWAKDLDNNFLFANKAICQDLLMCDSEKEALGKNDLFFAMRERERGHAHTFGELCMNSDEIVKENRKGGRFFEDGLVRGKYIMLDVHKAPMFDDGGNLIGTVGSGRDVTQDMKNLDEKQASDERYRLLAENVRDVIWTMDANLKFTFLSPSIQDTIGYTAEEFLSHPLTTHFPKSSIPYFHKFTKHYKKLTSQKLPKNKELQFWEFSFRHKNGSSLCIETVTSSMHDKDGVFRGVVGVSRDVSSRVETQIELERTRQEALAASKAKSEFLANMSHEIRTPMNGILGMLQLLETTSLDPVQTDYVDTAIHSGTNLLNLITDILDFSKIEAGKIELVSNRFNLKAFLQTVIYTFAGLIDETHIDLKLQISKNVPKFICTDKSRLQQILFNLLGNSVKFTSNGRIHLHVKAMPAENDNICLNFLLEDTGIGIPKQMHDQLFEPFVQADGSFRRKYKGTGLGLSIVRQLTTLMGGAINIDSSEGKGTTISFSILAQPDNATTDADELDEQENIVGIVQPAHIMVVEDEKINAMVIVAMLENLGHTVTLATSGRQAIEMIKNEDVDCLLMDIQMPDLDGIETARIIRKNSRHDKTRLPIIAVTAHAMKGDRENFLAAGMDDYLTKPVDARVLALTLQKLLGSKRS